VGTLITLYGIVMESAAVRGVDPADSFCGLTVGFCPEASPYADGWDHYGGLGNRDRDWGVCWHTMKTIPIEYRPDPSEGDPCDLAAEFQRYDRIACRGRLELRTVDGHEVFVIRAWHAVLVERQHPTAYTLYRDNKLSKDGGIPVTFDEDPQ